MAMKLADKIALITGAAGGIGRAISLAFAHEGADVVVGYRSSAEQARQVQSEIQAMGRRSLTCQVDVSSQAQVQQMVRTIVDNWGRIDILANVAGITLKSPLEDLTEQDWDRVIDVNLKGTFLCSQAVGRVMIEQGGGSILNIGSVSGIAPHCNRGAYGPSKAAVDMLSKVMAVEWAERNIRVNTIHPGTTETEMTSYSYPTPELRARREKTIPLKRFVKPEEVAAAAVFLVSDDAGAITGHSLVIDGGFQHGLFQLMERLIS